MLDEHKINYKNIDVSADKTAREAMVSKTGQIGVPVIEIDGEVAVGFDQKWIKEKLGINQ